jgi:hypothetical protein
VTADGESWSPGASSPCKDSKPRRRRRLPLKNCRAANQAAGPIGSQACCIVVKDGDSAVWRRGAKRSSLPYGRRAGFILAAFAAFFPCSLGCGYTHSGSSSAGIRRAPCHCCTRSSVASCLAKVLDGVPGWSFGGFCRSDKAIGFAK